VKIGISLSGGIDSGLIASIISKKFNLSLDTFSIVDEDERYNEEKNINILIEDNNFGKNYKINLVKNNFLNNLIELVNYHSSPVATITSYISSLLSKKFGETHNKVILSGIAGDELFLGYYSHYLFWLLENKNNKNFNNLICDWNKVTGFHVENPLIKDVQNFLKKPNKDHLYNDTDFFLYLMRKKVLNYNFLLYLL
jgi:asparagine synthase (glutamine-hydrolysing)